ncbi:MAG: ABC transporter permease subunit [Anaerolineales bacterium]|nr:ABC transporter permease subunit [Chloroflexota bacterium]MBL6980846.1 ABC transporter permease subunit [Anaerolineales bacterium]
MKKIWTLIRKEWAEVFKNRFVLFTVAFLPLLFTALPLIILYVSKSSGDFSDAIAMSDLPPQFLDMCDGLDASGCMQYFIVSQFMLLFMMVPMIVPITFASYSIVGEKTTRTLEPLLATPITTLELLTGKALAASIPAVVATWLSFFLYMIGARLLAVSPGVLGKLFDPLWLSAIFVVGPLLALAGVSIAVMISSRVTDPRVAEQISAIFVLPLIGLFVGQSTGLIFINEQIILWMAIGLLVLDFGLFAFATQLFQRETILTRWK